MSSKQVEGAVTRSRQPPRASAVISPESRPSNLRGGRRTRAARKSTSSQGPTEDAGTNAIISAGQGPLSPPSQPPLRGEATSGRKRHRHAAPPKSACTCRPPRSPASTTPSPLGRRPARPPARPAARPRPARTPIRSPAPRSARLSACALVRTPSRPPEVDRSATSPPLPSCRRYIEDPVGGMGCRSARKSQRIPPQSAKRLRCAWCNFWQL